MCGRLAKIPQSVGELVAAVHSRHRRKRRPGDGETFSGTWRYERGFAPRAADCGGKSQGPGARGTRSLSRGHWRGRGLGDAGASGGAGIGTGCRCAGDDFTRKFSTACCAKRMKFDGLVVTDAMDMGGVTGALFAGRSCGASGAGGSGCAADAAVAGCGAGGAAGSGELRTNFEGARLTNR